MTQRTTPPDQGELFTLPAAGPGRHLDAIRAAVDAAFTAGRLGPCDVGLVSVIEATGADLDRLARSGKSVAFTAQVLLQLLQSAGLTPDLAATLAPVEGESDRDELAEVLRIGSAARADRGADIG